jgi:hypothetical protein
MPTDLSDPVTDLIKSLPPLELLRVAPMPESERLSGLSEDSLNRHHADKIVQLSPRRRGMRVIHALMIKGAPEA